MGKALLFLFLLSLLFDTVFPKQAGNQQLTPPPQNPGQVDSSDKLRCGLKFSGYVHNVSSCVTIFCNFVLVSKHWAFMPRRCTIPDASGGVRQNKFTMGQLSYENHNDISLVQTVNGEKVIPHPEIPAVMVKLAPSFLPNNCFQSWLPVAPPQSEFYNVSVEGYRGDEPKLYIVGRREKIILRNKEVCEIIFKQLYNHAIHFCIHHLDLPQNQEFIPPGAPIYGYYKDKNGKEYHDLVGMKWRVAYFNERYAAIVFRLHNYVPWILSVIEKNAATSNAS